MSFEEARDLGKQISEFTLRLMQGLGQQDPSTGQTFMRMDDASFEIALQKEKDNFFLKTGYTTEYVQRVLREKKLSEATKTKAD